MASHSEYSIPKVIYLGPIYSAGGVPKVAPATQKKA